MSRKRRRRASKAARNDQRAHALQQLYTQEVARKKREAEHELVYVWEPTTDGRCEEKRCTAIGKRVIGRAPLGLVLPTTPRVCVPCASGYEEIARAVKSRS